MMRCRGVGVKNRCPMIAFDNRDGASGPEDPLKIMECKGRVRDVLQSKADEYMVECPGPEGQVTDIRLPECNVGSLPR